MKHQINHVIFQGGIDPVDEEYYDKFLENLEQTLVEQSIHFTRLDGNHYAHMKISFPGGETLYVLAKPHYIGSEHMCWSAAIVGDITYKRIVELPEATFSQSIVKIFGLNKDAAERWLRKL